MSGCATEWFPGEACDHIYADCRNLRRHARPWEDRYGRLDPHGFFVCGMCLHRHNRAEHRGELA